MVAATVSAIPNIPMQTAIATAIDTVHAASPSVLSQPAASQPSFLFFIFYYDNEVIFKYLLQEQSP
jgi:hypothetical protein